MDTVLVVGDEEDRRLVSAAVDTLVAAGVSAIGSFDNLPTSVDAACILWQRRFYNCNSTYADQCRTALDRAHRALVVSFDGSTLPTDLAYKPTTYVPLPQGGFESNRIDFAAWQRLIRSIVPDLLFDTSDLRAAVSNAAGIFRMWLGRGNLPNPNRWSDWTNIRPILFVALAFAFYVAGLEALGTLWPRQGRFLPAAIYTSVLILAAAKFGTSLVGVIEQRLPPGWDLDKFFPWSAFAAFLFLMLYGLNLWLNHCWFSLAPLFLLVLGSCATALTLSLVLHRSIQLAVDRQPVHFRACYISYPASLTALAYLLETEFAIQGIRFFDSWSLQEPSGGKNSRRSTKRRIDKAMQSCCILVTLASSEHLLSPLTLYERSTANSLNRPVLDVHVTSDPSANDRVAWHSLSLLEYLRGILHATQSTHDLRVDPSAALSRELLVDLQRFILRICPVCHGHGLDARYAWRAIPCAFRIRCHHCHGTGRAGIEGALAVGLFR